MKLFNEYTYIPYVKSGKYIDNILSSKQYREIYPDFEKSIDIINKKIDNFFFKENFNYPSKNFIVIEPHLIAFNLFTKSIILNRILLEKKFDEIKIEVYKEA